MPYYPSGPEQAPPGGTSPKEKKQAASRQRRMLQAGIFCLSAAMVLYGGIRLISYQRDLAASRKTKYELMAVMREADPVPDENVPGPADDGASAPLPQAKGSSDPYEDSASGAESAVSHPLTRSEMTVPLSDVSAAEAMANGTYVSYELPVMEYENKYQLVPSIQKLKSKSQYIIGWLKMDDLEEPVALKDNTFFLKHDAMGKRNTNGAIFLDEDSQVMMSRPYTFLLYGHNMKSGNMFGNLRKYRKFSYCFQHRIIRFDTLYEEGQYVIFAVETISVVPGKGNYLNLAELQSPERETRKKAVTALADYNMHATMVDVNEEDQILLLITCTGDDEERLVVAARRLRDGEEADRLIMR